jgi:dihydroorotate dehydrogenase electron transfer subunit
MKVDESAELVARQQLSQDAILLRFRSHHLASDFEPGQFTMVHLPDRGLLLRRPYSFCDGEASTASAPGWFSLLVKEVGAGTSALARLAVGDTARCLGPLGSTFTLPPEHRTAVIVAGGVGIAPFVALCRRLATMDRRAVVLLGGRSEPDLYLRDVFEGFGMRVLCTTEDGSFGRRGLVTELLDGVLAAEESPQLYSCGPSAMLIRVAEIARTRSIPHQVSLERRMGCGMGCCLGCVVYSSTERAPGGEYVRCCTEGPVLDAQAVKWNRDPFPL